MLIKIKQNYLGNLTYHVIGHSIIRFTFREEGVPSKCKHIQTEGKEIMSQRMFASHINVLSKYFVHKLLAIITRFFVGFVKIPAWLKISVQRNYSSFFLFNL